MHPIVLPQERILHEIQSTSSLQVGKQRVSYLCLKMLNRKFRPAARQGYGFTRGHITSLIIRKPYWFHDSCRPMSPELVAVLLLLAPGKWLHETHCFSYPVLHNKPSQNIVIDRKQHHFIVLRVSAGEGSGQETIGLVCLCSPVSEPVLERHIQLDWWWLKCLVLAQTTRGWNDLKTSILIYLVPGLEDSQASFSSNCWV